MKKVLVGALLFACALTTVAQESGDYVFTPVKELKVTPVKNQNRTGTCWSFSGLGFLEAELIRQGKGEFDLSEMFIVGHSYKDKADKYVRLHGKLNFGQGGSFEDVLYVTKHYGAVPESVMNGLQYGEDMHVHGEMEAIAYNYVNAVVKNNNGKLSTSWKKGYDAVIDSYLGEVPEKFTYNGKEYTPQTFAKELGLNIDDYVSLTSYTHHPFYSEFPLEIEDNWRWANSYNLPLDEFMAVFENAINTGYSIAWGSDVSEKGFTRNGIAVVPDIKAIETSGSDQDKWVGLSKTEKDNEIKKLIEKPCQEIAVTQAMRQEAYDNYQTTDDHGMIIYGIAKDQTGKKFYMVKNSWGTDNKYQGTWYASEAFVAYKTMNIIVHKDALPKTIAKKLGLK
ncbi:aminopeptidase C [Macellibacteroides fermentans]|jgi:aminopeptidase C|uniref:aminopeptidase C n=1 Tax=Macellibacteroides fermentans TaxID=879969 RepID=UPI000EC329CD|nr:C1 family peptidase [Parabacteroides sp.]MDD4432350.1 C1 family peptidase [Parabacteroides sp.]HAD00746.1 aminopeptidase [Porphyromonadaceae bacterium]HRG12418.1 C1 family peptidase [Macellibacteroides fermentans]